MGYENDISLPPPGWLHKEEIVPLPLKVFGVLCLFSGISLLYPSATVGIAFFEQVRQGVYSDRSITTIVIFSLMIVCMFLLVAFSIILGVRLLRNRRRNAAQVVEGLAVVTILAILFDMMLFGLNIDDLFYGGFLVFLVVLSGYLDPSLAEERKLQSKLRAMEDRSIYELGPRAGRDLSGKRFMALNFFNLFWIFTVCSIIGLLLETVFHFAVYGGYQDRAGLLIGPFSPIYGFGGVLMTLALNRFHDKSFILIFFVSAFIGGAFEYLTSWFMEFSFGITAWDYTGTWLSLDGRTNGAFMIAWGFLGVLWIKLLLPRILRLVNTIPWNLRYAVTSVAATLLILNGVMTLVALDFWYERASGKTPTAPVEYFFAAHFDDEFMEGRFESMSLDPGNATRVR